MENSFSFTHILSKDGEFYSHFVTHTDLCNRTNLSQLTVLCVLMCLDQFLFLFRFKKYIKWLKHWNLDFKKWRFCWRQIYCFFFSQTCKLKIKKKTLAKCDQKTESISNRIFDQSYWFKKIQWSFSKNNGKNRFRIVGKK